MKYRILLKKTQPCTIEAAKISAGKNSVTLLNDEGLMVAVFPLKSIKGIFEDERMELDAQVGRIRQLDCPATRAGLVSSYTRWIGSPAHKPTARNPDYPTMGRLNLDCLASRRSRSGCPIIDER